MKLMYLTTELIIGFFLLFVIIKFVGRKIINQITPFNFIASIVLGELLGNALYDHQIGIFYIVYSMTLWGFLLFMVEYLGQKFLLLRKVFEGKPSALIKNGVVDRDELKKNRMNLNQLQSLLRQSETFSIREVAFCYLEANGSISILKKTKYQKTTQEDFNMLTKPVYVPVTLIRDGEVLWDELHDLKLDESWLKTELMSHGISNYKNVFLAEWLKDNGLFVQTY
ncbi:hypothetical protein IK7_02914 [Bacillus cereus VD156]|uniref:DUF421 domain-containing protein n=1 Tax=Bacillus cereus TaxID=1396 RepID=UPI0002799FC9|nr:DUF421 domain-containing protein [Bacillus cereus]MED3581630.1 DUF421 domain-containing protein [Bacillus thuringiensis]EJR80305.1 hypothetical protein IK7_02914 [Bacillus cereus VD156]MCU5512888.1 DUF421 domain-containing protein [Bacillus cereus]MCU5623757.1 DUF421 domain-containing protein [Bacillus cereus]MCU5668799.1 DUF421 domain-containing protein [Bacillus cereus]